MWLSGSLGRGDADAVSDLDVLLAVSDERLQSFADEWSEWLAAITPTLIAWPLPFAKGSLYAVTPDRLRLDIVSEPASRVPQSFFRSRAVVFDRDGLDALVPAPAADPPSGERIAMLVEEFFRDVGMFPVVVEREDWLLGVEAIHLVRSLLYQLFVEMNAPLPPMGVKQWSTKLTDRQRAVLESLPTGAATREAVFEDHRALASAFRHHARAACDALGSHGRKSSSPRRSAISALTEWTSMADALWPAEAEAALRSEARGDTCTMEKTQRYTWSSPCKISRSTSGSNRCCGKGLCAARGRPRCASRLLDQPRVISMPA